MSPEAFAAWGFTCGAVFALCLATAVRPYLVQRRRLRAAAARDAELAAILARIDEVLARPQAPR